MLRHKIKRSVPDWVIEYHLASFNEWLSPEGLPGTLAAHYLAGPDASKWKVPIGWTIESRTRLEHIFKLTLRTIQEGVEGKANHELNTLLARYPTVPALLFEDDESRPGMAFIPLSDRYPHGESLAVYSMMQLAQLGDLSSFSVCPECSRIFKPRKANQKNCSASCSRAAYSKLPKEKERRRIAAREYYDRTGRVKPISTSKNHKIRSKS